MPPADTSRNLLFGLLALQNNFIDRDTLLDAFNRWAKDKAKPLGEILTERGALAPDEFALLEALVAKHVEKFDNDPEKSLAGLSPIISLRNDLSRIADADLAAGLMHVSFEHDHPEDDPAHFVTTSFVGNPTSAGTRFVILRPHAKGGLGQVSLARDTELNRDVALKEIQIQFAFDPRYRSRFEFEAEVTGGLEHPGIVPVYGLGHTPDGRPFYAMRFIKGDSLKDAIQKFHEAEKQPGRDPGQSTLELRELLGRFIDVCDAISYAHSRGVLHRDLKPSNIMLGKYGETLVVDWGLAKALDRSEPESSPERSESPLTPMSGSALEPTLAGSAVGTPAYMSPEQVDASVAQLGVRTDVYCLGATLFHLLAGQPPFTAADVGDVYRRILAGDIARLRSINGRIAPALEAVCLKAMALKPGHRYESVSGLKADVVRWLADEPVSAWREPRTVRARRWARRHRTPVVAVLTSALITLIGGSSGWVWYQKRERERTRHATTVVLESLARAGTLGDQARRESDLMILEKAVTAAEQARDNLIEADGNLGLRTRVMTLLTRLTSERDQALRAAHTQARDRRMLATLEQGRLANVRRIGVLQRSFDANSGRAPFYRKAFNAYGIDVESWSIQQSADAIQASAIREALAATMDDWARMTPEPASQEKLLAIARQADPDPIRGKVRDAIARSDRDSLIRLAREPASPRFPRSTVELLGDALRNADASADAVVLLKEAVRLHPDDFWFNRDLAEALQDAGADEDSLRFATAAVALRPDSPSAHGLLSVALSVKKLFDEALAEDRRTIELLPDDPGAHYYLAFDLAELGRFAEAETECRKAVELDPNFATGFSKLGDVIDAQGRSDAAIAAYRRAIELEPQNSVFHSDLAEAIRKRGMLDEALSEANRAVELDPKYATAHCARGNILHAKGQFDEAIVEYHRAIELDPKDSVLHGNLANSLRIQGKLQEALDECRRALELNPKDASGHRFLGDVLLVTQQRDEAIAEYRRAIELDPKDSIFHAGLANALEIQRRFQEAMAECRQAIELDPKNAYSHRVLGDVLAGMGQPDQAIAEYRRAIELEPKNSSFHAGLASTLRRQGWVQEALAECRRAIELDPRSVDSHAALCNVLIVMGRWDAAKELCDTMLKLDPKNATAHCGFGNILHVTGQRDQALAEYRRAIELDPKDWVSHANLAEALQRKERSEEALAEARRAIELAADEEYSLRVLGRTLLSQGQVRAALPYLEKSRDQGLKTANPIPTSAQLVRDCRKLIEMESRIPDLLTGKDKPKGRSEQVALAWLLLERNRPVTAVRLYAEALGAQSTLTDDLESGDRFVAALCASLAGTGEPRNDPPLDAADQARWRRQALEWLRADLDALTKRSAGAPNAARRKLAARLWSWKSESNLAGIRDAPFLQKLPEGERTACRQLWADLDALIQRASDGPAH